MRTLKQLFCRHYWRHLGKNKIVNEVLNQCEKCKVYNIWHRGLNMEYKTDKFPTNRGWEYIDREVQE